MSIHPRVSIIVPNYNHASYLSKRLDSIFNQSFRDFEVIILDDCSTDDSKEIIEKYRGHEKVAHIVYNKENSGSTFLQWERGLNLSKGEWIWIAESDDWCELNFLDVVVPPSGSDVVLSFCGSLMYRENDIISYPPFLKFEQEVDGREFCTQHLSTGCYVYNASMAVFKKSCSRHIADVVNYKQCGDWHFWILISLKGSVKITGRVLNYFRKHSGDVSGRRWRDGTFHAEFIKIQKLLLEKAIVNSDSYQRALFFEYQKFDKCEFDPGVLDLLKSHYQTEIGSELFKLSIRHFVYRGLKLLNLR